MNIAGGVPQEAGSKVDVSVQEAYWRDALGLIVVEGKEKKQVWQEGEIMW